MSNAHKSGILILFAVINIYLAQAQAGSKHTISIGEDSRFAYRFMIDDIIGASYSHYESDRTYSTNVGQSYTRSFVSNTYAIRLNLNPNNKLRYFFQFELFRTDTTYQRSTLNNSKSETTLYMYGIEYKLSRHFSVEGMVGFADRMTYYKTDQVGETEDIATSFYPATALAINYTF